MSIARHQSYAEQIYAILLQRIKDGFYAGARRLPAEDELSREFGVSRATIRTALAVLSADGLLIRKQGHGTYVNEVGLIEVSTRVDTVWEFTRLIEDNGRRPGVRLLACDRRPATAQEAKALRCGPDEQVFCLERIFLGDGQPVILSRNSLLVALLRTEPDGAGLLLPIPDLAINFCGQSIVDAIADISAVSADARIGGLLNLPAGTPLLQFEEIFYNQHGEPLVYGMNEISDRHLRLRVLRSRSAFRMP
jgi:GntR family transcriptional regulator